MDEVGIELRRLRLGTMSVLHRHNQAAEPPTRYIICLSQKGPRSANMA